MSLYLQCKYAINFYHYNKYPVGLEAMIKLGTLKKNNYFYNKIFSNKNILDNEKFKLNSGLIYFNVSDQIFENYKFFTW